MLTRSNSVPKPIQIACLVKMWYGESNLSIDQTAEAEYTMTRLNARRSIVAQRSHLSDFSVLAMSSLVPRGLRLTAYFDARPNARHRPCRNRWGNVLSDRQSSVEPRVKTPASQTRTACVPSGRLFTAVPELMTVHRSCVEPPP